jgi:glyceraldehyde 3-phosphate dehydrogenase
LDQAFGITEGWVTSVHAYTSDQKHLDNPHKDLRRARACTQSIVPTTTGIGKALKEVLPNLSQSIHGLSLRVPVPDVSLADMTLTQAGGRQRAFRGSIPSVAVNQ